MKSKFLFVLGKHSIFDTLWHKMATERRSLAYPVIISKHVLVSLVDFGGKKINLIGNVIPIHVFFFLTVLPAVMSSYFILSFLAVAHQILFLLGTWFVQILVSFVCDGKIVPHRCSKKEL